MIETERIQMYAYVIILLSINIEFKNKTIRQSDSTKWKTSLSYYRSF